MNQDHRKKIALVLSTLIIFFSQNAEVAGKNDRPNTNINKSQGSIEVLVKKLSEKYDFDFKNKGQQISPEELDSYKLLDLNFFKINQELLAKGNYTSYAFKVRFNVQGYIYIKNKYYNLVISRKPNGEIYYTKYDKNSREIEFGTRYYLIKNIIGDLDLVDKLDGEFEFIDFYPNWEKKWIVRLSCDNNKICKYRQNRYTYRGSLDCSQQQYETCTLFFGPKKLKAFVYKLKEKYLLLVDASSWISFGTYSVKIEKN